MKWFLGIGVLGILLLFPYALTFLGLMQTKQSDKISKLASEKIKGINFVAPPSPFKENPFREVLEHHIEWVSVIPYAFTPKNKALVKYNQTDWQWWGETREGVRHTIQLAHQNGLKVMLKPQVYIPGAWTGTLRFQSEAEWKSWEADYKKYILDMAILSSEYKVEMFCLGTEFSASVKERLPFWLGLIQDIRSIYSGKLIYSANWDHYQETPFWDRLDYIGISAYFPLTEEVHPEKEVLMKAWKPWLESMKSFSKKLGKKIIFTEFGYLSVPGAAGKTWELEQKIDQLPMDQTAQELAYEALFLQFWEQEFWGGGFVWKWFPEGQGHEGYPDKDYTPQGKKAGLVLKNWYQKQ
ncbi:MAG: hypothetical protein IPM48_05970 [Saprospiraceae bacterium]|nr:hypothetical protein [Saprospiraceae bacterium]